MTSTIADCDLTLLLKLKSLFVRLFWSKVELWDCCTGVKQDTLATRILMLLCLSSAANISFYLCHFPSIYVVSRLPQLVCSANQQLIVPNAFFFFKLISSQLKKLKKIISMPFHFTLSKRNDYREQILRWTCDPWCTSLLFKNPERSSIQSLLE